MSLKAKIEAVIYASEEPVTLQQLVGLLGQEAQAELDAADALQGQLALLDTETPIILEEVEAGDPDALNAETLGTEDFAAVEPAEPSDDTERTPNADLPAADEAASTPSEPETPLDTAGNDVPLSDSPEVSAEPGPEAPGPAAEAETEAPEAASQPETETPDLPTEPGAPTPDSGTRDEATTTAPAGSPESPTESTPSELRARERRLRDYMRSVLDALIAEYRDSDRGLEIREIANGFRFATKAEYHDAVRGFVRSLKPPLKLSLQALETLAVVAYKQPVTAPEVSEIRGVDSGGVLGSLMTRKLVTTAGRKQVIGRPILYKTTREFLLRFGLKDLSELPSIEEFERLASDLNEAVQEEISMPEHLEDFKPGPPVGDAPRNLEPMRNEHHAQADGIPNGPSDPDTDDEMLLKPQDGPGEFTGDTMDQPVDNLIDGRMTGVPPNYDPSLDEMADSPANDAAVQSQQERDTQEAANRRSND